MAESSREIFLITRIIRSVQILETCGPQPERCFRVCTLVNGPNTVSSRFYRACQEEYDINEEEEQRWKGEGEAGHELIFSQMDLSFNKLLEINLHF